MAVDSDICGLKIGDRHPVRLMGVINLSNESFYKASVVDGDSVLDVARKMVDEGATMIDVGARSTWPLAKPISRKKEISRLLPVLDILQNNVDAIVSVDTMFSDIAEKALSRGVDVVNDVSGFTTDPEMMGVVRDYDCPAVVMASMEMTGDPLGMDEVITALDEIIHRSESNGIDPSRLILDPAIGKWVPEKEAVHDFEVIDQFQRLQAFEKPILAAISRKSVIDAVVNKPADERLQGSLAATAITVHKGAHIIRTHDVAATVDTVKVASAMRSFPSAIQEDRFRVSIIDITVPDDLAYYMRSVGVTPEGCSIMKNKSVSMAIRIDNITSTEALIIKQEILARGGDAAISKDAISQQLDSTDVIVIGTLLQFEKLIQKLSGQSRDLPLIAQMLRRTLESQMDIKQKYPGTTL